MFRGGTSPPAVGRNGDALVVFGTEAERVAALGRDGTPRFILNYTQQVLAPIVALPDGSYVFLAASIVPGSTGGVLQHVSADGAILPSWPVPSPIQHHRIAVGPEGRVYFSSEHHLYALCPNENFAQIWHMEATGILTTEGFVSMRVEADETLTTMLGYGPRFEPTGVRPDGTLFRVETLPARAPDEFVGLERSIAGSLALVGADTLRFRGFLRTGSQPWVALPDGGDGTRSFYLDSENTVWISGEDRQILAFGPTAVRFTSPSDVPLYPDAVVDGGGFLVGGDTLRRLSPDNGRPTWTVDLVSPHPDESIAVRDLALAVDGVAFGAAAGGVIAVQTDALPPEEGCPVSGLLCNAARDSSAREWDR